MFSNNTRKNEKKSMLLTEEEACEYNAIPGTTAIIVTYNTNPRIFALSLLSLLRCTYLEHVIVVINGPDDRIGDPSIQDVKQSFLEAIRKEKFNRDMLHLTTRGSIDMPLTVMRIWSRLGHSQAIDSAIPWVHTKNYILMHDDVLIMKEKWNEDLESLLEKENVGFIHAGKFLMLDHISKRINGEKIGLGFPHPGTTLIVAKRSRLNNFRWSGYFAHAPSPRHVFENLDLKTAAKDQKIDKDVPENAEFLSYDVGAFMLHHLKQTNMEFLQLPNDTALHLTSFSWLSQAHKRKMLDLHMSQLDESEKKARLQMKNLFNIYFDYFGDYPWDYEL